MTLQADNLAWLKRRAQAGAARSVSDMLDRLVTDARTRGARGEIRSVVGTIDVDPADPLLDTADEYIQALFAESRGRAFLVKEEKRPDKAAKRKRHD